MRPHDLRPTFACQLSEASGHTRAELEHRLGHANDRYLKLCANPPGDVAAAYVEDLWPTGPGGPSDRAADASSGPLSRDRPLPGLLGPPPSRTTIGAERARRLPHVSVCRRLPSSVAAVTRP
ncbi:hypothetical protein GCM10017600_26880 [Streptosporangium carneum]|uniref:Uncharacterized protein n=1 Tax=Streptosporangium carneum TaxID=47481 RepID=A0A9W6MCQ6_9ACTN|nr:hypothetical protein GCM10017600_26880 [Streptosporangium carneum]